LGLLRRSAPRNDTFFIAFVLIKAEKGFPLFFLLFGKKTYPSVLCALCGRKNSK
jgi:hypothetical protein